MAKLEPLPAFLLDAVNVEFCQEICDLEAAGWTVDALPSMEVPYAARETLGEKFGAWGMTQGVSWHVFLASLQPPYVAMHLTYEDVSEQFTLLGAKELEPVEETALGLNPLLALANMNRLEIAQAFEALCKTASKREISALCYHAAEHPEDLFAITTAVRAGADAEHVLLSCLNEPHEPAVEVAVHLLGEIGSERAYDAIDALHVWDRGVFADAMKKIRARQRRPEHLRGEAIAVLASLVSPWTWPLRESEPRPPNPRFSLWDLDAMLLTHEPREHSWWRLWGDELPPNARAFARLSIADGVATIERAGQTLFEVRLGPETSVEALRVDPAAPLGAVLLRMTRDTGYRAAAVVEIGVLVARDETWTALPREDRRDVLYLSPDDAPIVLAMLSTALAPS